MLLQYTPVATTVHTWGYYSTHLGLLQYTLGATAYTPVATTVHTWGYYSTHLWLLQYTLGATAYTPGNTKRVLQFILEGYSDHTSGVTETTHLG